MAHSSIAIAPGVLRDRITGRSGLEYGTNTSVLVETVETDAATRALARAAVRFSFVTADGIEHPQDDAYWNAMLEEDDDPGFPSWVSDVFPTPAGPALVMDWEDDHRPLAGATMVAILVEELTIEGVTRATVTSLPPDHRRDRPLA